MGLGGPQSNRRSEKLKRNLVGKCLLIEADFPEGHRVKANTADDPAICAEAKLRIMCVTSVKVRTFTC
jgi:hypothetical protein